MKALIGIQHNDVDDDVLKLKADNKLLEDELNKVKIKCKEYESKATMYFNEKIKKDKLN